MLLDAKMGLVRNQGCFPLCNFSRCKEIIKKIGEDTVVGRGNEKCSWPLVVIGGRNQILYWYKLLEFYLSSWYQVFGLYPERCGLRSCKRPFLSFFGDDD